MKTKSWQKIKASCGGSGCELPHEKVLPRGITTTKVISIRKDLKKVA